MSDETVVIIGKTTLKLYDSRSVCFGRDLSACKKERLITRTEKKQSQILKNWLRSFK